LYSRYLGGFSNDRGNAIAIDKSGNAYVTGETNSLDFPTVNALFGQCNCFPAKEAFITKRQQFHLCDHEPFNRRADQPAFAAREFKPPGYHKSGLG
jgi:beta-propeller repeat-containing protein